MIKSNLHTHTTFCDGKNTPEDVVKEAIERGFDIIGFSAHAYTPTNSQWCLKKEREEAYAKEIIRLKEEYKDKRLENNNINLNKVKVARIEYRGKGLYIDELLV